MPTIIRICGCSGRTACYACPNSLYCAYLCGNDTATSAYSSGHEFWLFCRWGFGYQIVPSKYYSPVLAASAYAQAKVRGEYDQHQFSVTDGLMTEDDKALLTHSSSNSISSSSRYPHYQELTSVVITFVLALGRGQSFVVCYVILLTYFGIPATH
jgi:hypothetical protein